MEQQLAALYNKLAKHIVAMIPVKWDEVYYLGEIEKGKQSYSSVFYFRDVASGEFVKSNNMPKIYQMPKSGYMVQWSQLNNKFRVAAFCERCRFLFAQLHQDVIFLITFSG